jgi:gliding motility-associated-like protein
VAVTDNNGCVGKDTISVNQILPQPNGFLPADTVICSYGKLELRSMRPFSSYLWWNNSAGPTVTVTQPGLYWLQVVDGNNCTGRDTIIVNPKDCMKGFYIPNAFTPNHDGNNDVFKPLLFGNVKQYHFTIYNRWSEKVFETTDLSKGWDGTLNGIAQDSNVFVWICTYQFDGESMKVQKGTVVLIR